MKLGYFMSKSCVMQVQIVVGAFLTFSLSLPSSDLGTNYKEAREFKV